MNGVEYEVRENGRGLYKVKGKSSGSCLFYFLSPLLPFPLFASSFCFSRQNVLFIFDCLGIFIFCVIQVEDFNLIHSLFNLFFEKVFSSGPRSWVPCAVKLKKV